VRSVRYHVGALGLLGAEGRIERRPVPELEAWARANDVVLPAAYREWAELGGGALLEKYSNCSKFHFDAPALAFVDGQRGLLFERETQDNFDTVVLLDRGDDPPVLFGWLGDPPWVVYTERFSEAVYAQLFDWQFHAYLDGWEPCVGHDGDADEDDEDGGPEIEALRDLVLRTDRHVADLRARYQEIATTRYLVEGEPYVEHRFLTHPPGISGRLRAMVFPDRTTHISLLSEGAPGLVAQLEADLREAFKDEVVPAKE
jgi:hypothetical protein